MSDSGIGNSAKIGLIVGLLVPLIFISIGIVIFVNYIKKKKNNQGD